MAKYCEGKKKTKVTLFVGSQPLNLEFPSGIEIKIISTFQMVVVRNQGLCNDAWYENYFCGIRVESFSGSLVCGRPSLGFRVIDEDGMITFDTGQPSTSGGARAGTLTWSIATVATPTPGFISSNLAVNCKPNGYDFQVFNSDNVPIYSRKFVSEAKYTVACDDDCPEGYCKCLTDKYPGYCCVPCAETASKIRNIAAKVGKCCG